MADLGPAYVSGMCYGSDAGILVLSFWAEGCVTAGHGMLGVVERGLLKLLHCGMCAANGTYLHLTAGRCVMSVACFAARWDC